MEFPNFNEKIAPSSPERQEGASGESIYQDSLEIVRALHTASVVVRQYPPTNELVIKSIENACETLKGYLKKNPVLTIGEVAGNLLVDELCFADKDQKKPFVKTMADFLSQRKIQNVTFLPDINFDELRNFLELIGERPEKIASIESLNILLEEKGIKNIKLNEKIYRITSKEEQEKEKFKEEILTRFLGGTVPSGLEKDLLSRTLVEGDPQKIVDSLMGISSAAMEEPDVFDLRVQTIIQFVQKMIELIKTTSNRLIQEKLRKSLMGVLSQLETGVLVRLFTSDVFSWNDIPGLRETVLNSFAEDKYLKLVKEVAQHYQTVASSVPLEEKKTKMQPFNQLFEHLLLTPRGKSLAGKIYQQLTEAGIISPTAPQISKEEVKEAPVYKFLLGEDKEEEIAARVLAEISPPRLLVLLMQVVQRIVKENVNLGKTTQVARLVEFIQRMARLLPRITNSALREKLKAALAKAISSLESSLLVGLLSHETTSTMPELGFPGTVLSLLPEERYLDLVELTHREQKAEDVESRKFLLQKFHTHLLLDPRVNKLTEKIHQRLEEQVAPSVSLSPLEKAKKWIQGEDGVWISSGKIESLPSLIKELDSAGEEGLMLALVEKLLLFSRHPEPAIRQRVAVSAMEIWNYAVDRKKDALTKILEEGIPVWWEEENANEVFSLLLTNVDAIVKTLVIKENLKMASELMEKLAKIAQRETAFHQNEINSLFNRLATEELLNILINTFEFAEENNQQIAGRILYALGVRAVRPLIEVLRRAEKMRVRKNALTLLQAVGKESLSDIVSELQRPQNPWYLIRNLVLLLGELGDKEVCNFLTPTLAHPDVRVRRETVKALAKIGGEKAVSLLISCLYDRDLLVRKATVVALGDLGEAKAVPDLRNLMSIKSLVDKDPSLQAEVCIALGKIKSPAAVPDLIKIIERRPWFHFRSVREDAVRVSACWALGEIGGREAKSALGKVSRDPRSAVREAAQKALSQLPG